ncbi:FliM/FliN family flagellar motor switch protein [bacterium]|nr:FliM/FliN family flagellar motor switch protein [bacterium]
MHSKTENIFKNLNINLFSSQICEVLKAAYEKFWEHEARVTLQAINSFKQVRDERLVAYVDFFSSQIKVENHKPVLIRLSKEFTETILNLTLKPKKGKFEFTKLTPLEIKVLNAFCEFLYKRLKDILISPKEAKLSDKSEKYINLLLVLEPKGELCSKIMISIPQDRINFAQVKKVAAFSDEDFISSNTTVKIKAGSSRISFDELQNLAPDDIIVLENSELTKLTLISGDVENKFNIKINSSLIVNLDDDEDEDVNMQTTYEEVIMGKNLWDDIQIEVNAEFDKVKMTIGELKQITQGQIVDLGSIFENEISLYVEDRKVAVGDLIIINDRYAVRLNKILSSNTQKAPINAQVNVEAKPQAAAKPKPQPQVQAKPQPQLKQKPQPQPQPKVQVSDDEEFDYSDFEK